MSALLVDAWGADVGDVDVDLGGAEPGVVFWRLRCPTVVGRFTGLLLGLAWALGGFDAFVGTAVLGVLGSSSARSSPACST